MIIRLERTGGFAGLKTEVTIDTKMLPESEARRLLNLVEEVDFFSLPSEFQIPKKGADYYHFILTVESEGRKHTTSVREDVMPSGLKALAQKMISYARRKGTC